MLVILHGGKGSKLSARQLSIYDTSPFGRWSTNNQNLFPQPLAKAGTRMRAFFTLVKQFSLRVTMLAGHTVLNSVNQKLIDQTDINTYKFQKKKNRL